ncbi:hypothetical protein ACP87_06345 [Pseudomonas oleovorans]|nr:hypothetical protein [Pseudomonas oleovorans]MBN7131670.1 hypothetical protein [Pseudomonas oleovorans]MBN7141816.1 hypothetical protein [Pseudomonas oleovorans]
MRTSFGLAQRTGTVFTSFPVYWYVPTTAIRSRWWIPVGIAATHGSSTCLTKTMYKLIHIRSMLTWRLIQRCVK